MRASFCASSTSFGRLQRSQWYSSGARREGQCVFAPVAMSRILNASQYDKAYSPHKLGNWEQPDKSKVGIDVCNGVLGSVREAWERSPWLKWPIPGHN